MRQNDLKTVHEKEKIKRIKRATPTVILSESCDGGFGLEKAESEKGNLFVTDEDRDSHSVSSLQTHNLTSRKSPKGRGGLRRKKERGEGGRG